MTIKTILVTGGAGFVGSMLVPALLKRYRVKSLDSHLYGDSTLKPHDNLEDIHGDVRDTELLKRILPGCDAVIHLACISNDPSYELNPALGKSINYDSFGPLVDIAKDSGVKRFIYASSSSVYGIQDNPKVSEDLPLKPQTDYSKYKALCEDVLLAKRAPGFVTLILRPATISGYSPRFRMDVLVNICTMEALVERCIKVFGGTQKRANLFMADMVRAYQKALTWPAKKIDGQVYNVGAENFVIGELAKEIRDYVQQHTGGGNVTIETLPTNDTRSYSLSSERIAQELGFTPRYGLLDALANLTKEYQAGRIVDPINNARYYNLRWLQQTGAV